MPDTQDIQLVDTPAALDAFCNKIKGAPFIAVDTEFLREKTYYPKLCLLQVATPDSVACIDPLALDDLSPLLDIVFDTNVVKVMHAARQDMEIFYHLREQAPAPVFDTQIAALLLGHPDQIGYGNLVNEVLGVMLDKLHSRADWSERPLSRDLLRYAADDVIYLVDVYRQMHEKLELQGRLDWLADDFRQLSDPALYSAQPEQAWLRVKGINKARGTTLSVIQALASWREELAQAKDRSRGWLMRDDVLTDIARQKPASLKALGRIRGVSDGLLQRDGQALLAIIGEAADRKPAPFPGRAAFRRLTPSQDALTDLLTAVVRLSAETSNVNPSALASRKQLEKLVTGDRDCEVLRGWRRQLVGEQLLDFLEGNACIGVENGRPVTREL